MKLNELKGRPGSHKKSKRLGRGTSSGKGKTSGKGVKGQKARAGVAINGFEGGQMPLHMRMPKRGFNNIFAKETSIVNVGDVQKAVDQGKIDAAATVDMAALVKAGLCQTAKDGVRLLANGKLTSKITFAVTHASAGAVAAVEAAGGSVAASGYKPVPKNKGKGKDKPGKKTLRRENLATKRAEREAAARAAKAAKSAA
jgi:large subunit ribosomal protein L15